MKRLILLACCLTLGACTGHQLAEPSGPLFQLNTGEWTAAPGDLRLKNGFPEAPPAPPVQNELAAAGEAR